MEPTSPKPTASERIFLRSTRLSATMLAAQLTAAVMILLAGLLNLLIGVVWPEDRFFTLLGALLLFGGLVTLMHSLNIRGAQRFLARHGLRSAESHGDVQS